MGPIGSSPSPSLCYTRSPHESWASIAHPQEGGKKKGEEGRPAARPGGRAKWLRLRRPMPVRGPGFQGEAQGSAAIYGSLLRWPKGGKRKREEGKKRSLARWPGC